MFGTLTEKFRNLLDSFAGKKTLSEENLVDAVRQIRMALLDADVNYSVASQFVKRVKEKVLGSEVLQSVKPGEQFAKVIHDELVFLMGSEEASLSLKGRPCVIMLCGLQGAGKTTQCAKLSHYLQKQDKERKILLVACDLQRPAAVQQLVCLGEQSGQEVFFLEGEKDPRQVAKKALQKAEVESFDVVIVDTAGRLHVDEELMHELKEVKQILSPIEVLFVASANTGQDAVKTAQEFNEQIGITGTILTMLDGSARAGAAISIREVTQKPLKFEGIGEKISDLQLFNPNSMADRILGMGDVINLVKRAEESFSQEETADMEKKLLKASFTYADCLKAMKSIRKMGSIKSLLAMIPGFSSMDIASYDDTEIRKVEAIIYSMTPAEREERVELIPSRRRRIAKGSGTHIDDVNRFIKKCKMMKQMMKDMPGFLKQSMKGAGDKENFIWR
jgi:signal recognition particle subunit SRP54